jgi:hypothetical protein
MSANAALERLLSNYDSDAATVNDGDNDEDPSHGSQSENESAGRYLASESHAILSRMSNDDDDGESSDDMASAEIEDDRNQRRLMAERNARIRQKKLRRRGLLCSEEEDDDESVILTQSKNNPYRKLSMQEQFTPPRKKSKTVVPDTDEDCEAECNDSEEQSEDEEVMTPTPRRRHFQTQWQHVKEWSKDTHQEAEINRKIDAIMEQSLKDAGYRAEHVSNTKTTDRAYWKESHVRSFPLFFFNNIVTVETHIISFSTDLPWKK